MLDKDAKEGLDKLQAYVKDLEATVYSLAKKNEKLKKELKVMELQFTYAHSNMMLAGLRVLKWLKRI